MERTWLFFVFVIYRWWWELLVLLVLVKLVLLVGRSVLSVVLMRRRRRLVVLLVVVAIGLGHGAEAAAAAETRSGYRAVPKKESQRKSGNTFAKLKRCPIIE